MCGLFAAGNDVPVWLAGPEVAGRGRICAMCCEGCKGNREGKVNMSKHTDSQPGKRRQGRMQVFMLPSLLLLGLMWSNQALAGWTPQVCKTTTMTASTPSADFTDNGDGTVTHGKTGLMWKRCAEGQLWSGVTCTGLPARYTWQGGLQQAVALNNSGGFASFTDWRLPNIKELNSIVEEQCAYPAVNSMIFPSTQSDWYWSSSPYAADDSMAWYITFDAGFDYFYLKTWRNHVRLVRAQ